MRTKMIAVFATVLALLAPASAAYATAPYTLTVDTLSTAVYPAVDGYLDTAEITGTVDAGGATERIRGSVVVTVGNRVVKSFPIITTGPFHLVWNGRAGNGTIVSGPATISLRVGTQSSAADRIIVSAKKLVTVTHSWTQPAYLTGRCFDDETFVYADDELKHIRGLCIAPPTGGKLLLRGTKSTGSLNYEAVPDATFGAVTNYYHPAVVTITASFTQSGAGVNDFYLCETHACVPPSTSAMQTFSGSGTHKTTGYTNSPDYPTWRVVVHHGHDLSLATFKITISYWVLR